MLFRGSYITSTQNFYLPLPPPPPPTHTVYTVNRTVFVDFRSCFYFWQPKQIEFLCKHSCRRPSKEASYRGIASRFQSPFTQVQSQHMGQCGTFFTPRVSKNPNNNYFSVIYFKGTALLAIVLLHLRKLLGKVGKWNSGMCCLTIPMQSTKICSLCRIGWHYIMLLPPNEYKVFDYIFMQTKFWLVRRRVCYNIKH